MVIGACSDDPTSPEVRPPTIQDKVDSAAPGDTILLEPGTYSDFHEYTDFIGRTVSVAVVLKDGVVLRGATGDPADVVLDMQGVAKGIWLHEAGASTGIADLTIRNATWAITGYDASPWVTNCVFENNGTTDEKVSAAGTGIYFDKSSSVISDCIFRNNEARSGAGAAFGSWSDVRLERCQFTNNVAVSSGGGLRIGGESGATLIECTFTGNSAGDRGGGIFAHGPKIHMVGGSITGNSAGHYGGGCEVSSGATDALFEDVTISDNTALEGPQGRVGQWDTDVVLKCCDTDPAGWAGSVTFDDEGCGL